MNCVNLFLFNINNLFALSEVVTTIAIYHYSIQYYLFTYCLIVLNIEV